MLLVLSLLFTLLLLLFSLSILLLLKALLWLLVLLVLLFPHFTFTDVFVLLFVLFFSLHVMNCYFLSSFSFAFYFFVFVLFYFVFTSDEKTILFTWLTFQVKVCKLLCFFVYFFACLFCFLKWNRRVKIHNLIAFLQLTKGF